MRVRIAENSSNKLETLPQDKKNINPISSLISQKASKTALPRLPKEDPPILTLINPLGRGSTTRKKLSQDRIFRPIIIQISVSIKIWDEICDHLTWSQFGCRNLFETEY